MAQHKYYPATTEHLQQLPLLHWRVVLEQYRLLQLPELAHHLFHHQPLLNLHLKTNTKVHNE
jgi:hypothetical protein